MTDSERIAALEARVDHLQEVVAHGLVALADIGALARFSLDHGRRIKWLERLTGGAVVVPLGDI